MGIQSMTGFARVAGHVDGRAFAWEIRAVNGRSLDIKLRTPPGFDSVGDEGRKRLGTMVARGTIHITLTLAIADGPRALKVNLEALSTLMAALAAVTPPQGIGGAAICRHHLAGRGDMGLEPVDLFAEVSLGGQQCRLLMQPCVIKLA